MQDDGNILATRSSLLVRLRDADDRVSWQRFFDTYWKLIYRTALRSGLSESEAEDVVQETVLTVARNIAKLGYDRAKGSFKGWLLQTTRWRIADAFRRRMKHVVSLTPGDGEPDPIENLSDPVTDGLEAIWDEEWRVVAMDAAVQHAKRLARPKQFQIFDLYVVRGWTVKDVCRTLGVSATQVYLAKHRLAAMIRKQMDSLEDFCP